MSSTSEYIIHLYYTHPYTIDMENLINPFEEQHEDASLLKISQHNHTSLFRGES